MILLLSYKEIHSLLLSLLLHDSNIPSAANSSLSNHFDMLMSKIIFKKEKKYYFNVFLSEKHFKKQL